MCNNFTGLTHCLRTCVMAKTINQKLYWKLFKPRRQKAETCKLILKLIIQKIQLKSSHNKTCETSKPISLQNQCTVICF